MTFEVCEMQKVVDKKNKEPNNVRMSRLCKQAMNSISEDLTFTTEVPEDYPDKRLPTLDFVLWMHFGLILHSYYEKSMRTLYV